jgi:[ribosomal protein S18]-alanine N-acetyltransferase
MRTVSAAAAMKVMIRDATNRDLPQIMGIERLAFDHPWSQDSFVREMTLPFSRIVVATAGDRPKDRVIGYLCRWLVADECHILNIAVEPESRRMGVAARLMRDAISEAKSNKAQFVTLEVRRSNLAARNLYRKFAFQDRRLRRNYYGAGEDAIVMELRLNNA